jgi:hypothetical protein
VPADRRPGDPGAPVTWPAFIGSPAGYLRHPDR